MLRRLCLASALLLGVTACDFNEFGPSQRAGGARPNSYAFTDPAGDLLPGVNPFGAPDVTAITVTMSPDTLTLRLTFVNPISPWSSARSNSLDGFVDFDLDENSGTGIMSAINEYGGNSDLGAEFYLSLRDSAGGRWVALMNATTEDYAMVPARFNSNTLTVRIPRVRLNDPDGTFRMSMVLGNPTNEAADFAPNSGFYRVAP